MNICHYLHLNICVYRLFVTLIVMDTFLFLFSRGLLPPFGFPRYFVDILSSVGYDELIAQVLSCASLVTSELVCLALFVEEFTVNSSSLGHLCCF